MMFCAYERASRNRETASSNFPTKCSATPTTNCLLREKRRTSSAGGMGGRKCCRRNTATCLMPSLRLNLTGALHEHCAERQRPNVRAALQRGLAWWSCLACGKRDGADEGLARGGRPLGGFGKDGIRDQHGLWKTRIGADFGGAGASAPGQPCAVARVRRRRAAERSGNASDDAAARKCAGEGSERRAADCGGDAVRDAERASASGDSVARICGRIGRPCTAGASRAGRDWRRKIGRAHV